MKLLLIEDNPTMQATLQRTLERRGMQVLTCGDGDRALALWQASLPDAVLLDLSLPGVDGLEVLRQIKSDPRLKTIPVVIMTSSREEQDLARGYALGVNAGLDSLRVRPFEYFLLRQRPEPWRPQDCLLVVYAMYLQPVSAAHPGHGRIMQWFAQQAGDSTLATLAGEPSQDCIQCAPDYPGP